MSPNGDKFDLEKFNSKEKGKIRTCNKLLKMTPLRNENLGAGSNPASAEKVKTHKNLLNKSLDDISHKGKTDKIDYQLTKVSQSTEALTRKFVSKIERNSGKKKYERSPLIKRDKLGEGLLDPGQSDLENDCLPEFDPPYKSTHNCNNFTPKVLNFADKSADYENHLLSNDMPRDEDSIVYTPSFDHKNEDFNEKSPLSLIKPKKDYYERKRGRHLHWGEDRAYGSHHMMNNDASHYSNPMFPYRGVSQPPPVDIRNQLGIYNGHYEEDKDYEQPRQYYPTCNCHKTVHNVRFNPYGYYYAPANILFSPRSIDSEGKSKKRHRKSRRKSRDRHHHRSSRTKSAFVGSTIPLLIVPTMKDDRVLLHAYPMEDEHSHHEEPAN